MPVVQKLMDNLVARYGKERGESVYYAMEGSGKGPFAPGGKHHDLHLAFAKKHGIEPVRTKKKAPAQKSRGRAKGR
jgi:hypothetical protein